jgi:hypothetical protein
MNKHIVLVVLSCLGFYWISKYAYIHLTSTPQSKYKFEYITNCDQDFTVNGVSVQSLTEEQQVEILEYLLVKAKRDFNKPPQFLTLLQIVSLFECSYYMSDDKVEQPDCGYKIYSKTVWDL